MSIDVAETEREMETRNRLADKHCEGQTYTFKSNARRAAKAAGLDPDTAVIKLVDGTFKLDHTKPEDAALDMPECVMLSEDERKAARARTPLSAISVASNQTPSEDPVTTKLREELAMAKKAKTVARIAKLKEKHGAEAKGAVPKRSGGEKDATLIKMLAGKGSTVEALTKELGWLAHTLRARISRLAKPKSKGGEGLKVARERVDGVTTYRVAP